MIVFFLDNTNSLCSDGDPLDEKRRNIDRDISRLEERLRVLKSCRNELSPIYCLPVEVLCKIFKFSLSESRARKPESWTNFSQVSQHWRTSALSEPELWANIPFNYPRWAEEMLIRSKMVKLTIRSSDSSPSPSLDTWDRKTIEIAKSCLYEMNRVAEIKFTTIPGSKLKEIFRDLPKSVLNIFSVYGSHIT